MFVNVISYFDGTYCYLRAGYYPLSLSFFYWLLSRTCASPLKAGSFINIFKKISFSPTLKNPSTQFIKLNNPSHLPHGFPYTAYHTGFQHPKTKIQFISYNQLRAQREAIDACIVQRGLIVYCNTYMYI